MQRYKKIIIALIAIISINLSINTYAFETLYSSVIDVLIKTAHPEEKGLVEKFPINKAFGDVIKDGMHFPFINVKLAKEQGLIEHQFYEKGNQTIVILKLVSQKNLIGFREFIKKYSPYSDINLINGNGESIGCLRISDYQKAVNLKTE